MLCYRLRKSRAAQVRTCGTLGRSLDRSLLAERLEARFVLAVEFLHDFDDPVRALIPTSEEYDELGFDWLGGSEPFDDSAWTQTTGATNGVGYDRNGAYDPLISLDVESEMFASATNTFARAEFSVDDLSFGALIPATYRRVRFGRG